MQVIGSDTSTLFSTGKALPEYCIEFWASHIKKNVDRLEKVQKRVIKTEIITLRVPGSLSKCSKIIKTWPMHS